MFCQCYNNIRCLHAVRILSVLKTFGKKISIDIVRLAWTLHPTPAVRIYSDDQVTTSSAWYITKENTPTIYRPVRSTYSTRLMPLPGPWWCIVNSAVRLSRATSRSCLSSCRHLSPCLHRDQSPSWSTWPLIAPCITVPQIVAALRRATACKCMPEQLTVVSELVVAADDRTLLACPCLYRVKLFFLFRNLRSVSFYGSKV